MTKLCVETAKTKEKEYETRQLFNGVWLDSRESCMLHPPPTLQGEARSEKKVEREIITLSGCQCLVFTWGCSSLTRDLPWSEALSHPPGYSQASMVALLKENEDLACHREKARDFGRRGKGATALTQKPDPKLPSSQGAP